MQSDVIRCVLGRIDAHNATGGTYVVARRWLFFDASLEL